jgi:excisionase family DNA binding protein
MEENFRFEPLLNTIEAGQLLKMHEKTLARLARSREIPAMRIGRLWRFRASQLDAWLNAQVGSVRQPA